MMGASDLTVHSYPNNGPKGSRPRQPLVHVMYNNEWRDLQSMSFHPDDAPAVVRAITRAANAAKAGRKIKETKITLRPEE